jgi:dolichyl-diphosphooligosaccharide--protein glycosyltransferase
MTDEREVAAVLAERPELESALEAIRDVDDDQETWTFDDLSMDSGTFGEVVSEGLVEKTDDGYRLPDATRRALDGEEPATEEDGTDRSLPRFDVDRRAAGALAGALALVVLFRTLFSYRAVFRNGDVVLSGNDPYYYRYWVEQLLAQSGGGFEFAVLTEAPGQVVNGEPLLIATLYWLSSLLGDGATAVGTAMAWYPVLSALVTGLVVYLLAIKLTDDRRVGLAAVAFFATTPAHAMRTSLGYADHHAFDYVWLALTALALVSLADRDETAIRDSTAWALGLGLGICIAGQLLAWENGPALVFPLALYVALVVLLDVDADRSPLQSNAPLLGGVAVATVLTQLVHSEMGWHTDFLAVTPVLLLVGTAALLLAGEVSNRRNLSATALATVELVGGFLALILVQILAPRFWQGLTGRVSNFFGAQGAVETQALISGDITWFVLLGFVLVLALPPLVWSSKRAADGSRGWLAASVYTWYFILLGAIQVRFVGELATFTALFAGFGFVWLTHWVDLSGPPAPFVTDSPATVRDGGSEDESALRLPTPREAGLVLALFLLVGGVGIMQVPVKTGQLTIDGEAHDTATWIQEYAADENRTYPDNYVLSQWGRNRMFNYFVNGESRSYGYAKQNYRSIYSGASGESWYQNHRGRVSFLVTESVDSNKAALHNRLHTEYQNDAGQTEDLAHYRALYVSPSGEYKVFSVVPGAEISGTAARNATATVSTPVEIPGASFTYKRTVRTNGNGTYDVTVPYPGEYTVENRTVTVTERNVTAGETVG